MISVALMRYYLTMRLCTVEGCGAKHWGKGFCQPHYHQAFRNNPLLSGRICDVPGCGRKHEAHGLCRKHYKATEVQKEAARVLQSKRPPKTREARNAQWVKIQSDPVKSAEVKAAKRLAYRADPDRVKDNVRFHNTGFSRALFDTMRAEQGGRCGICRVVLVQGGKQAHSECCDHEEQLDGVRVTHKTPGAVKVPRGLLCSACNKALGYYENAQRLVGFVVTQYEDYIACPPVARLRQKVEAA